MRGKYFADYMLSFALGNEDITNKWKALIKEAEDNGNDAVVFFIPKRDANEFIAIIERVLREKTK